MKAKPNWENIYKYYYRKLTYTCKKSLILINELAREIILITKGMA